MDKRTKTSVIAAIYTIFSLAYIGYQIKQDYADISEFKKAELICVANKTWNICRQSLLQKISKEDYSKYKNKELCVVNDEFYTCKLVPIKELKGYPDYRRSLFLFVILVFLRVPYMAVTLWLCGMV